MNEEKSKSKLLTGPDMKILRAYKGAQLFLKIGDITLPSKDYNVSCSVGDTVELKATIYAAANHIQIEPEEIYC